MLGSSRNKAFLIVSGIFLFLFLIVFLMTSGTNGLVIDETIAFWAQDQSSTSLMKLIAYASVLGSSEMVLLLTVLIGLILLIRRSWRNFLFFFTVSVGGVILNFLLKILIQRERPGDEASYIEVFNFSFNVQSYSFPSGHTMRATIFFLFLVYITLRFVNKAVIKYLVSILCIALLLGAALSRIILDAHFATDVAGGLLISVAWFFFCLYFFHKRKSGFSFIR